MKLTQNTHPTRLIGTWVYFWSQFRAIFVQIVASEDGHRGCYDVFRGHRIIKRQKFVQKSCETTIENTAIRAQIGYVLFSIFDLPFANSAKMDHADYQGSSCVQDYHVI